MAVEVIRFGPVDVAFDGTVLRPRPWTLAQSEWAAKLAGGSTILELGSGAGHIGLAAAALSGCGVVQVDRDPAACRWAAHDNAARNGYAGLVVQRCGTAADVLTPDERFAVIIADPPYVPSSEVARFPEDPLGAIDGGPDGLALIRSFLTEADRHLAPGGSVILQVGGENQVEHVEAWLTGPEAPALVMEETRAVAEDRLLVQLRAPQPGTR